MLLFYMPFQGGASRWHECCMYLGETDFHYNVKGSFTMRKTIALGLLALLFGFLSNSAFAGNADEFCGYLKDKDHADYQPGLYGLCTAWHNADEDAKVALGEKFLLKAGFAVPGSGFGCICWPLSFDEVCEIAQSATRVTTGLGSVMFFDDPNGTAAFFGADTESCALNLIDFNTNPVTFDFETLSTLEQDPTICVAEVQVIAGLHLAGSACD